MDVRAWMLAAPLGFLEVLLRVAGLSCGTRRGATGRGPCAIERA
jgi:hypothetical protein